MKMERVQFDTQHLKKKKKLRQMFVLIFVRCALQMLQCGAAQ